MPPADVGHHTYLNVDATERFFAAFSALLQWNREFADDCAILSRLVLAGDYKYAKTVARALAHKVKDQKPDLDRAAKTLAEHQRALDAYKQLETAIAAAGVADRAPGSVN